MEPHIQRMIASLAPVIRSYVAEFADRARRRFDDVEARVAALETQATGVPYKGVWGSSEPYKAHEFVTFDGSIWFAKQPSVGSRPGTDPNTWQLAVKRGADGRAGKDATR